MTNRILAVVVAAGVLTVAVPTLAHHSEAMYDSTRAVTLTGTVTEFRLTNPHITILFDVKPDQGDIQHWSAIGENPVVLRRQGWNRNTIKPKDQITITGHRAKDGRPLMTTEKIVVNGKEMIYIPN